MEELPTTKQQKRFKGAGAVEIILAVSLFMVYATFLIGALVYSISTTKFPNTQKSAIQYATEGMEIIRYIRKDSLANLPNGTYGLNFNGSEWTLSIPTETLDSIYTRTITISSPTAEEKLITSSVAWNTSGRSGSESVSAILSNWQDTIIPPTVAWQTPVFNKNHQITATSYDVMYLKFFDGILYSTLQNGTTSSYFTSFNVSAFPTISQGTNVNVTAVATDQAHRFLAMDGGRRFYYSSANNSVELAGVNVNTRALLGVSNQSGNADANGIAASGNTVYLTRAANGSSMEFNIIQNTGTSTYTTLGSLNSSDTFYDVVWKNTTYAYVTTSNTAGELLVINISNSASPSIASTINFPTSTAGRFNLTLSSNYLIATRNTGTVTGSQIYFYDITNPATPTLAGSFTFPYLVYDTDVDPSRSFLFVVSNQSTSQFSVIDFSIPNTPTLRGNYPAATTTYRSVAWDSVNDRAYIGTTDNTNEIVILDAE